MTGMSICIDTKKANTKAITTRMRKLTARMEKIEANAKKAEMRSNGQITA